MHTDDFVLVKAPAKVNLSLDIVGNTPDGYHLLETVMQSIDLCDFVRIEKRGAGMPVMVACNHTDVPENERNIAYKAAMRFFAQTGMPAQGVFIRIEKNIPMQAGLAGGSTDAAAVLLGLNHLYGANLSLARLAEIGLRVGADVPFCLNGGCVFAQGKGEKQTVLPALPGSYLTVAKPETGVCTKQAFARYDTLGPGQRPDTQAMLAAIRTGDLAGVGRCMTNVFTRRGEDPDTDRLTQTMLAQGALGAVLSGSGSAVIGLFAAQEQAAGCLRVLQTQVQQSWLLRPLPHGVAII